MKNKFTRVYALFFAVLSGYLFLSFSSNPPNGRTGAPGEGLCSDCHFGGVPIGSVSIIGLPATITPNTSYPIAVNLNLTNPISEIGGFQMVVLDNSNNNVGTLSNPGASSTTQPSGGRTYFEHNPAQFFSGDLITYTVDWTSPANGSGDITMYAAANFANGNGSTSGDFITTTTSVGEFMASADPITVTVTGTDVTCFGGNDGSATANPTGGGGPPYFYAWSNALTTQTITGLTAGTYTVTVSDAIGSTGTGTIDIGQPATPVAAAISNQTNINCINVTGSATAQGSGGTPSYTYEWSNGSMNQTATFATAGIFMVTVSDANQCTATVSVTITEDTAMPIASAGADMQLGCTTTEVTLDGTASDAGAGISYNWSTVGGNILSGANTTSPTVNQAGEYTITVTNNTNGCTATASVTVTSNAILPFAIVGAGATLTCTTNSVTLDGSASSSGANITYSWTTADGNIVSGATTTTPTVDAAGTYTLTVTDNSNGCTASNIVVVDINTTAPTANAGNDRSLNCNNLSVTLDGSASSSEANISYLWTTADGNIVSGATTNMPTVDAEGTYILTVTDNDNGCTATDEVQVTQTPDLSASTSNQVNVDCNGESTGNVTAAGSGGNGGYTFQWSNGDMTAQIGNLAAGTYTVIVTDADNCTATASATITEPDPLLANASSTDETSAGANDGSATAAPSGGTPGYTYLWSNSATTQSIMNLSMGSYTVTVTDDNGCTVAVTVSVNGFDCSGFTATSSTSDVSCNGGDDGEATVTPSGGTAPISYAWSNGQSTQTATGLMASNHSVTLTDADGCELILMVTVNEPSAVSVSTTAVSQASCNDESDGSITVEAMGGSNSGFTFSWSNMNMGAVIGNLAAGEYTVTATDDKGCTGTLTVTITEPSLLVLEVAQMSDANCNGEASGTATVEASGGTPDYTYEWPNGNMGASRTDLAAGTYEVTTTDANDCTTSSTITIGEPSAITANFNSTDETAVGANDGTASVTPSGGIGEYTYLWDNGATTQTITNLAPDTYCVTVTDANGCTFEGCTSINPFGCGSISIQTNSTDISCFGEADGTGGVVASGFTDPISYTWSNEGTEDGIDDLAPGTYTVTVTDVNGCSAVDGIEIASPAELAVNTMSVTNADCNGNATGAIAVAATGGTPDYTYAWPGGATSASIENLQPGFYEVTATDANGCTASLNVEVGVDPDIELPTVILQNITVELDANGTATITPMMIDNGSTDNCGIDTMVLDISTFTCDDIGENEVVLAVADESGNCGFDMATVTVVDNIPPSIECPDDILVESSNCEEIVDYGLPTVSDNCSTGDLFVSDGPASGSSFPSGTTEVSYTVEDLSNNETTCTFAVTINNGFSGNALPDSPLCNGFSDGSAMAEPAGGAAPFTFLWDDDNAQTAQTAVDLSAGTYSVTITDATGCTTTATAEVVDPPALEITVDQVTDEVNGNMDGAIEISVSGGAGGYAFDWVLNGATASTDEDPTGLETGNYTLVVTDENGCTEEIEVMVDLISSTNNPELEKYISIFPNPVSENLFIEFDLPQNREISFVLLDLTGRPTIPETKNNAAKKSFLINTVDYAAGIYILKMVVGEEVFLKRIVVSK